MMLVLHPLCSQRLFGLTMVGFLFHAVCKSISRGLKMFSWVDLAVALAVIKYRTGNSSARSM